MKKRLIIFIFVLITVFAAVALLSACDGLSGLLGGGDADGSSDGNGDGTGNNGGDGNGNGNGTGNNGGNVNCEHDSSVYYYSAVEPDCLNNGNVEYWECGNCGKKFADEGLTQELDDVSVSALGHDFGDWEYDNAYHYKVCKRCREVIDRTEHTKSEDGTCSCGYVFPDENGLSFGYIGDTDSYIVYGSASQAKDIVIPSEYKGKPVTYVGSFANLSNIESVVIPDSVTIVYVGAFENCNNLKSYAAPFCGSSGERSYFSDVFGGTMPDSLKEVKFTSPRNLTSDPSLQSSVIEKITIVCDRLESVDSYMFSDCSSLEEVIFEGESSVASIEIECFANCTSLRSVTLPESIKILDYGTFENCSSLESVVLPVGLQEISGAVFKGSSIGSIVIPVTVASIRDNAFEGMKNGAEILFEGNSASFDNVSYPDGVAVSYFYNNVTTDAEYDYVLVGDVAYITRYKGQGGQVTVPVEIDGYGVISYRGAFNKNENAVKVVFEEGVTEISPYMFDNCYSLNEVVLPASLKNIGDKAFYSCERLSVIDLSVAEALESIEDNAFGFCKSLNEVYIPSSVKNIGNNAFYESGMVSVEIGENSSIESLGDAIFASTRIEYFEIPANWKSIPSGMFSNDTELKEVTIEEGSVLETIYGYAFDNTSIERFYIPASLTAFGGQCFDNCPKLTAFDIDENNKSFVFDGKSLLTADGKTLIKYVGKDVSYTVPAGVETIFDYAIKDRESLEEVILPDGVKNIGTYGISDCGNLKKIVLPETLETIDHYAFSFNSALKEVELPSSLQEMSYDVFYNDISLEKIVVPSNVAYMGSNVFGGCYGLVVMIEAASMPEGWDPDAIGSDVAAVIWDCNNNATSENGEQYYMTDDGFTYLLKDGTAVLIACDESTQGDVVLPETVEYDGTAYSLKEIGSYAFLNCKDIVNVVLPEGLEVIGENVFNGCTDLKTLTIPQSVDKVGGNLFIDTYMMVVILCERESAGENWSPYWNSVHGPQCYVIWSYDGREETIYENYYWSDDGGFYLLQGISAYLESQSPECEGEFTVPAEINSGGTVYKVTSIWSKAFENCKLLTKVVIEADASLGGLCFNNCTSLEEVVLPSTIREIPYSAFEGCTSLRSVNLPDTLQTIGDNAFNGCSSLNVEIPAGVTGIGGNAFYGVASVTVNEGNEIFSIKDDFILKNDTVLVGLIGTCDGELVIPDYVTEIQEHAFEDSQYLEKVVIPASVTYIGEYAFYESTVEEVIFAGNSAIKEIRSYAFANCYSLRSIVLPEGLEVIGDSAFSRCYVLWKIVLPSSVISIGNNAFDSAWNLKKVVFAEDGNLQSIGDSAFAYTVIEEIILPDGLKSIGSGVFSGSSLKMTYIPSSVTDIASGAFSGTDGLTIYCEAESAPSGWIDGWDAGQQVVWGYTAEEQA